MEELYCVANKYYKNLESLSAYGGVMNKYFLAALISLLSFIIGFYLYIGSALSSNSAGEKNILNYWFILTIFGELALLFAMNKIKDRKEKNILSISSESLKISCGDISEAKVNLLKSYFSCEQSEFAGMAKNINSMLEIASQSSNNKSVFETIFSFVYNKDSNPRILTLFILICSMVIILSVNTGVNLYSVIDIFSENNASDLISIYFASLIIILILGFGVVQVFLITKKILIFISLLFLGQNTKNIEIVRYLVKDLNNFHAFNKTQDKRIIIDIGKPNKWVKGDAKKASRALP